MGRRRVHAMLGAGIALPFQAFQLWIFLESAGANRGVSVALVIANLVLLGLLCTAAADFSLAHRAGKAALLGSGVAMLMPGATVLDHVVAISSPDWDAATWIAAFLPYALLLAALSAAEAGLYLLATRPRVVR